MGARWRELRGAVQSLSEQNGHLSDATAQLQNNFSQFQNHLRWVLDNEVPRQVCVETGEYGFTNPETGLFSFLYSYLPERGALDIGANHGVVSEQLLKAGYEVYAFEPLPETYDNLVRRLGKRERFRAFPFALGSRETEMPLHVATLIGRICEDLLIPRHARVKDDLPFLLPFDAGGPAFYLRPDRHGKDLGGAARRGDPS